MCGHGDFSWTAKSMSLCLHRRRLKQEKFSTTTTMPVSRGKMFKAGPELVSMTHGISFERCTRAAVWAGPGFDDFATNTKART